MNIFLKNYHDSIYQLHILNNIEYIQLRNI